MFFAIHLKDLDKQAFLNDKFLASSAGETEEARLRWRASCQEAKVYFGDAGAFALLKEIAAVLGAQNCQCHTGEIDAIGCRDARLDMWQILGQEPRRACIAPIGEGSLTGIQRNDVEADCAIGNEPDPGCSDAIANKKFDKFA